MAAKGQSPLLGYNTNVRHKGRVFHIQTEDSGIQHPHVITHLFADGGRILKSVKTPYGELLEVADWETQVKKIMQDQHKAMFIALRDGQYDHLIDGGASGGSGQTGAHRAVTASAGTTGAHRAAPSSPGVPSTVDPGAQHDAPARAPSAAAIPAVTAPSIPAASAARPPSTAAMPVQQAATPSPTAPSRPSSTAPSARTTGPNPAASGSSPPPSATTGANPALSASRSGRYAPVRSPEILGSFKPKVQPQENASIFGDGLMSEKSLDEVILAYLADDLDDKKR